MERTIIVLIMLVLCIVILTGCETSEGTAMLGALMSGNAIYESDPQRAVALATFGNAATGYANAQANAPQININTTQSATPSPQTLVPEKKDFESLVGRIIEPGTTFTDIAGNKYVVKEPFMWVEPIYLDYKPKGQLPNFFTYKKWDDFNKNDRIETNELWGCGEPIKQGENFYLYYDFSYMTDEKGEVMLLIPDPKIGVKWNLKMFSPAGQCVLDDSGKVPNIASYLIKGIPNDNVQALIKNMGSGTYKAVIDTDEKTEVIDFELQHSGRVNVNVRNIQPDTTNSTNEAIGNTKQASQTLDNTLYATLAKNSELSGIGLLGSYDLNKDGVIDMDMDSKEASVKNTFVNDEKIAIGLWLPPHKMKVRVNQYEIESGIRMLSEDIVKYRDGRTDQGTCLLHYVDVNNIKFCCPNGVQGGKKYELRSYLDDDNQPFATRTFDIDWDLNAEDIYGE